MTKWSLTSAKNVFVIDVGFQEMIGGIHSRYYFLIDYETPHTISTDYIDSRTVTQKYLATFNMAFHRYFEQKTLISLLIIMNVLSIRLVLMFNVYTS